MIHALPGMGADTRMFPDHWHTLPDFVPHDWPRHKGEMSLAETAQRVCDIYEIRDGDAMVGASLGGMVACEVAKIRKLRSLYLIGSATGHHEINHLLATLRPLAQISPIGLLRFSAANIPLDLAQMFSGIEASFIRAMCDAIFKWEGLDATAIRCFRIHGSMDLIIPPPAHPDLLLRGGHLISITHAKECVEFIRRNEERFKQRV